MQRWSWVVLACGIVGCGGEELPEDGYRAALPPAELLRIGPGGAAEDAPGQRTQGLVGAVAELYGVTRQTGDHLNGLLGGILGHLWGVVQHAPSAVGAGQAVWGPFTPALSPVSYRVVVVRAPGHHEFRLEAAPKATGAFVPVLAGVALPAPPGRAAGHFRFDLERLRALDPIGHPVGGQLGAGYDVGPGGGGVRLHLEGVADLMSADYGFDALPGGGGALHFAAPRGLIHARWLASGAGRAELRAGDGGQASECWNPLFARVFFVGHAPGQAPAAEGDPAACALPTAPGPLAP